MVCEKECEKLVGTLKYIAYLCDNSENLAKFYGEFFQDLPEGNRLDLSQTRGCEVAADKWERVAA